MHSNLSSVTSRCSKSYNFLAFLDIVRCRAWYKWFIFNMSLHVVKWWVFCKFYSRAHRPCTFCHIVGTVRSWRWWIFYLFETFFFRLLSIVWDTRPYCVEFDCFVMRWCLHTLPDCNVLSACYNVSSNYIKLRNKLTILKRREVYPKA